MDFCYYCNRPASATWMTTDNRPACRHCTADLADCPYCMRVILPGYGVVDYEKEVYCYRCADERTCCSHCQEPIFGDESSGCCSACLQRKFCRLCARDCSDAYYLDEAGTRCSYCCTCKSCGERGADVVDRKCPGCSAAPVVTLEEGLALYPAAYEFIRDIVGLEIERIPRLLVSLEMPEVKIRHYPEGLKEGRIILGYHGRGDIWVRGGCPEHACLLILVHELAHAWQAENCPYQSDALTEGFARWLEYQCALYLNYPAYAERLRDDLCPVYGGGLRKCLMWEGAVGPAQLLEDLRMHRDFPDWIVRGWHRQMARPSPLSGPPAPARRARVRRGRDHGDSILASA